VKRRVEGRGELFDSIGRTGEKGPTKMGGRGGRMTLFQLSPSRVSPSLTLKGYG